MSVLRWCKQEVIVCFISSPKELRDLDNQMLGQMEKNKNEIEEAKKALETNKEQIEVNNTEKN